MTSAALTREEARSSTSAARSIPKVNAHDLMVACGLGFMALLHVAAWTRYPSDVDPINFVRALEDWDVTRDTPHPPGYPLFVAFAKLASQFAPGVRAYEIVNLGLMLGASALLYLTFRRRNSGVGAIAALLLASHPLLWAATVSSESYGVDAFLGVAVFATALFTRRFGLGLAILAAFGVYLVCALTRTVSCVMLLPLGMVTAGFRHGRLDWRRAAAVGAVGVAAAAGGYMVTALLAGGLDTYRRAADAVMGFAFRQSSMVGGASATAHAQMVLKMAGWFLVFAAPGALLFLAAPSSVVPHRRRELSWIAAAWVLPPLAFYATIYYLKPTYHLILLPALLVAAAFALWRLGAPLGPRFRFVPALGLAAAQLAFFWFTPASAPEPVRRLTRAHFQGVDGAWDSLRAGLAQHDAASSLVVYRDHPQLRFRALYLIIPDRVHASVPPDGSFVSFFDPVQGRFLGIAKELPPHVDRVLVVDSSGETAVLREARLEPGSARSVREVLALAERSEPAVL